MKSKKDLNIVKNYRRKNHRQVYRAMVQLRQEVMKISTNCLEEIFKYITKCLRDLENNPEMSYREWHEKVEKLLELYYKAFERVYKLTSQTLKQLFGRVQDFNPEHIKDLTYSKDGIAFEDRISKYWDKMKTDFQTESFEIVRASALYHYDLIIDTEAKTVEQAVKKHKKPIVDVGQYVIQVIDGCGGGCNHDCIDYNGIYPEDEDIEWPPYHPSCTGIAYYDVTDDPDEIHDLDLDESDLDDNI